MRLTYESKTGELVEGYFSDLLLSREDEKIAGEMTIYKRIPVYGLYDREKILSIPRSVRIDDNGVWFFTFNRERFNFLDFIVPTPKEFCENITKKSSNYRDSTLSGILVKYGLDSIRVMHRVKKCDVVNFCGMVLKFEISSSFDKEEDFDWIEYKFVKFGESDNPLDNYKLRLVPVNPDEAKIYPTVHTYTSDLVSMFRTCTDKFRLKANV